MAAAQALDFREFSPGKGVQAAHDVVRRHVEHLAEDRPLYPDHNAMAALVASGEILEAVEAAVGSPGLSPSRTAGRRAPAGGPGRQPPARPGESAAGRRPEPGGEASLRACVAASRETFSESLLGCIVCYPMEAPLGAAERGVDDDRSTSTGAARLAPTPHPVVDRDRARDRHGGPARRVRQQQQQQSAAPARRAAERRASTAPPGRRPTWRRSRPTRRSRPCCRARRELEQPARGQRHPVPAVGVLREPHQQAGHRLRLRPLAGASARRSAFPRRSTRRRSTASSWRSRAARRDMVMSDMYDNAAAREAGRQLRRLRLRRHVDPRARRATPRASPTWTAWPAQTVACESGTTQQAFLQTLNKQFASGRQEGQMTILAAAQPARRAAGRHAAAAPSATSPTTPRPSTSPRRPTTATPSRSSPTRRRPTATIRSSSGIGIVQEQHRAHHHGAEGAAGPDHDGTYQKIVAQYGLLPVTSAQINQGTKPIPTTSASP